MKTTPIRATQIKELGSIFIYIIPVLVRVVVAVYFVLKLLTYYVVTREDLWTMS